MPSTKSGAEVLQSFTLDFYCSFLANPKNPVNIIAIFNYLKIKARIMNYGCAEEEMAIKARGHLFTRGGGRKC